MDRTECTYTQCLYSTSIPLLPLWTVRPLQSLSACKVQLNLYSPMGRTTCTEPQSLYRRAILLLHLWAVQPVQSLCVCTVQLYLYSSYGPYSLYKTTVPENYSYTSNSPMVRTDSTNHQCLYNTAINLLLLWTVQTVHNLSACTVQLYLYSPYGPCGLYRASVPVQYTYTSTTAWTVQILQSLSACTVQL